MIVRRFFLAARSAAGPRLARSIALELVLLALVCYAAAELVSVHPLDYGHRIPS